MKIDFLGLEAFISIADLGNFRRAASHLNLSQTAISHRVRKLEDSLGVQLFTRTSRQVSLTQAGADLLPRSRELLAEVEQHLDHIRERNRDREDRIALACLPTIAFQVLPPVVARFQKLHPRASLRVHDNSATEIGELVASGVAEFGITILAANRWDLAAEALLTEDYLLVCPRDHKLARKASVSWADLDGFPLIRVSQQTANRIIVDEALGTRSERLKWTYEVQHTMTAFMLVRQGVGLAITPRMAVSALRQIDLAAVPMVKPKVTRTVGILARRDAPGSMLGREFQRLLREEFAALSVS
ncbi:MAG: LysR family transcriptional regulator [Beijerinckiaceae bacterium]|nr:LysR family transcriptional regulator [Beijerinckiaceae bacterium]MDO9441568.1 LysR family transcriptional regulator [Beijerinckiaceae bacterium]